MLRHTFKQVSNTFFPLHLYFLACFKLWPLPENGIQRSKLKNSSFSSVVRFTYPFNKDLLLCSDVPGTGLGAGNNLVNKTQIDYRIVTEFRFLHLNHWSADQHMNELYNLFAVTVLVQPLIFSLYHRKQLFFHKQKKSRMKQRALLLLGQFLYKITFGNIYLIGPSKACKLKNVWAFTW